MGSFDDIKDWLDVVDDMDSLRREHEENIEGVTKLLKGVDDRSLDIERRLDDIVNGWDDGGKRRRLAGVMRDLNRTLPVFKTQVKSTGKKLDEAERFLHKVEDRLGAFPESERAQARRYVADSLVKLRQIKDRYGEVIAKYDYAIKLYINAVGNEAKINTLMLAGGLGVVTSPLLGAYNGFREGRTLIGMFRGMIAPLMILSNLFGRALSEVSSRLKSGGKAVWETAAGIIR